MEWGRNNIFGTCQRCWISQICWIFWRKLVRASEYVNVILESFSSFNIFCEIFSEFGLNWSNDDGMIFFCKIFLRKLVRCVNYNDVDCCVPPLILSSTFHISKKWFGLNKASVLFPPKSLFELPKWLKSVARSQYWLFVIYNI